jgi:prepilin-type N-terminal cleavage/methylation domain-containing protein
MINIVNQRSGFTILELLVVISIIGVLGSVVLSAVYASQAPARDAKRIQQLEQINKAIEIFNLEHGHYPIVASLHTPTSHSSIFVTLLRSVHAAVIDDNDGLDDSLELILIPDYLGSLPRVGNHPYYYSSNWSNNRYPFIDSVGRYYCIGVELEEAVPPAGHNSNCLADHNSSLADYFPPEVHHRVYALGNMPYFQLDY